MSYTNDDDSCLNAEMEGRKARRAGHGPYCTFSPDCDPKYYNAWHAGWINEDKIIKGQLSL